MKRKDKHNGFAIPPQLTARTMAQMARHPGWVAEFLTTEPLRGSEPGRRTGVQDSGCTGCFASQAFTRR